MMIFNGRRKEDVDFLVSFYEQGNSQAETARKFGINDKAVEYHLKKRKVERVKRNARGKDNGNWKGGIRYDKGYRYILKPEHPNCNYAGYIREHRVVMEKKLGRYLRPYETIHHKNGVRDDNRIENLELIKSQSRHMFKHRSIRGDTMAEMYCSGGRIADIARYFSVDYSTVRKILITRGVLFLPL